MKIAIRSSSAAVARTLADVVRATGHEVSDINPALVVADMLHPATGVASGTPQLALTTPVRPAELAHAINVKLTAQPTVALAESWQLAVSTRQLTHADMATVPLTEKECLLLAALAGAYPESASRETLLRQVWAYGEEAETHTLETHVYRLRAKLSALHPRPCDILTLEGSYRLVKE